MRKSLLVTAVAALAFGPVSALAAITLNGQPISDFSITHSNGNIAITTVGVTGPTDPTDPTDPTGPTDPTDPTDPTGPTDPTDPTDPPPPPGCGAIPGNVELLDTINWASQGSQYYINLDNTDISSSEFTTTTNSRYSGQVSVVSVTGTSGFKREVWISECPGGAALSQSTCKGLGTSSTNLYWSQGSSSSWQCNLERGKRYYLNYRNVDCTRASCDVYRNLYNNKQF